MDILEMTGGTALTLPAVGSTEETLFEIEHKLPYTPEVMVFFYMAASDGLATEEYAVDRLIYSGSIGTMTDVIYASVDERYFRLKHLFERYFDAAPTTSTAPQFSLRVKYYILSNDSHIEEYDTKGF